MSPPFPQIIAAIWLAWLTSWWIAALWHGRASVKAPRGSYRGQMAVIALGFLLLFASWPRYQWMLWPVGPALGWAMVALTLAGVGFTWWARVHLGALWSGGVEAKEGHRVVESGPYALVRHPIYSGLIAAAAAMAVVRATPLSFAGVGLFALGFALKARVEERFLEAELGGYDDYRRRVPMLVPLPWRG